VQASATEAEIKKAYYIKARQCHPDKHKDDEVATQQFQELAEVQHSIQPLFVNGIHGVCVNPLHCAGLSSTVK
jgi:hypothetical protein